MSPSHYPRRPRFRPQSEHRNSVQSYTVLYDQMVAGMRRRAPKGTAGMKWMGLALAEHNEWGWWQYFLNATHHAPGTPIDYASFHL